MSVTVGPPAPNRLVQTALVAMPDSVVNGSGTTAGDAVKVLRADIKPLMAGTGLAEGITGDRKSPRFTAVPGPYAYALDA